MYLTKQFFMSIIPDAQWYGPDLPHAINLVVDSRLITRDTELSPFFVALKGKHHDGTSFIHDALQAGACGVIARQVDHHIRQSAGNEHKTFIIVADVLAAVIAVARAWRAQITIPVIGITGSVGKTSTKELLAAMVRHAHKNALVSHGNQNTVLGCALTMWRLNKTHEVAIFEMGISKKGEMIRMAELVRPTLAAITYIGHSHAEALGNPCDVAAEKRAIFSFFDESSIGVIQGDQHELTSVSYHHPIIKFGKKMTHQVQMRKVVVHDDHIRATLSIYNTKFPLIVPTTNTAVLNCILAASALAHLLKIPFDSIVHTVQQPLIVEGRYQTKVLPCNAGILIHDAYNASPESMKAALLAFEKIKAPAKIAVLGDMLELGSLSGFWHRQIGRFLKKVPSLTHLILVGSHVEGIKKTAPLGLSCIIVPTWQEAVGSVKQVFTPQAAILVKASRGIALHNLVEQLEKNI